jgi:hypothetical protein
VCVCVQQYRAAVPLQENAPFPNAYALRSLKQGVGNALRPLKQVRQQERPLARGFPQRRVAVSERKVARAHVRLQQDHPWVARGCRAQPLREFCGLPVGHARVMQARGEERGGVCAARDVV